MGLNFGYGYSSTSWAENYEDASIAGQSLGIDFSVPFKPLAFAIGFSTVFVIPQNHGDTHSGSQLMLSLYGRYLGSSYDIFLGPGFSVTSNLIENTEAAPDKKRVYSTTQPCGFTGIRSFFGKDKFFGLGLTSYYCSSSSYQKTTVDTANASTTTKVEQSASAYGGVFYIVLEWDERRTIF